MWTDLVTANPNIIKTNKIFGTDTPLPPLLQEVVELPVKLGGLGIVNVVKEAAVQYAGSSTITRLHMEAIIDQADEMPDTDDAGLTVHERISEHLSEKSDALNETVTRLDQRLTPELLTFAKQARDKGSGCWLTALPLTNQGFSLSKCEFRDALKLRYNLPITDVPSLCVCG